MTVEGSPIICFLLVNRIRDLPELSIQSVLQKSKSDIYIGYINEADLSYLPNSPRIHLISLKDEARKLGVVAGDYKGFNQDAFYQLVQLKWTLFDYLLRATASPYVIYSDLDVIWLNDPISALDVSFKENTMAQIFVQDATSIPGIPFLCMGIFIFRNSAMTAKVIQECISLHAELLLNNPATGDDEVINKYYMDNGMPNEIQKLPQSTFPVGNMLNAYSRRTLFYGIPRILPFIFHANFVIGNRRKVQLLLIMHKQILRRLPPGYLVKYIIARIENLLITWKNRICGRD